MLRKALKMFSFRMLVSILIIGLLSPAQVSWAGPELLFLPQPGQMMEPSAPFAPMLIKGLVIHPKEPLKFDFILDVGQTNAKANSPWVREESSRLIKYFLAALTIPDKDLWVNLSPYEKDTIIPNALGQTVLGRDLLAQDYVLKQITSSLIYPEKQLGKEFWGRVYAKTKDQFGQTNIAINSLNKVWILPQEAEIYAKGNAVYVTKAHLKVMLDCDYLALQHQKGEHQNKSRASNSKTDAVMREVVIPQLEKEVNTGKNFALVRQMYYSLILAKWYKVSIQSSLIAKVYADKNKIKGVDIKDPALKDKIYQRYLNAYKKGVFNYIKEEIDSAGQMNARKYFAGGMPMYRIPLSEAKNPPTDSSMTIRLDARLDPSSPTKVPRINLTIDGPITVPAFKEKLLFAMSQESNGEIRDIVVNQNNISADQIRDIQGMLEGFGFEQQQPNQKTLKKALSGSQDKLEIKPIPRQGENNVFHDFEVTLPSKALKVVTKVRVSYVNPIAPTLMAIIQNIEDAIIYLPESKWDLPRDSKGKCAQELGISEDLVHYRGWTADMMKAIEAENEKTQNDLLAKARRDAEKSKADALAQERVDKKGTKIPAKQPEKQPSAKKPGLQRYAWVITLAAVIGVVGLWSTNPFAHNPKNIVATSNGQVGFRETIKAFFEHQDLITLVEGVPGEGFDLTLGPNSFKLRYLYPTGISIKDNRIEFTEESLRDPNISQELFDFLSLTIDEKDKFLKGLGLPSQYASSFRGKAQTERLLELLSQSEGIWPILIKEIHSNELRSKKLALRISNYLFQIYKNSDGISVHAYQDESVERLQKISSLMPHFPPGHFSSSDYNNFADRMLDNARSQYPDRSRFAIDALAHLLRDGNVEVSNKFLEILTSNRTGDDQRIIEEVIRRIKQSGNATSSEVVSAVEKTLQKALELDERFEKFRNSIKQLVLNSESQALIAEIGLELQNSSKRKLHKIEDLDEWDRIVSDSKKYWPLIREVARSKDPKALPEQDVIINILKEAVRLGLPCTKEAAEQQLKRFFLNPNQASVKGGIDLKDIHTSIQGEHPGYEFDSVTFKAMFDTAEGFTPRIERITMMKGIADLFN